MATCPECEAELDIDEFDVEKGDELSCDACGTSLRVMSLSPLEVELLDEDEDDDEDEDEDEDEDDKDDLGDDEGDDLDDDTDEEEDFEE